MDSPKGSSQHPHHFELNPKMTTERAKKQGCKFFCFLLPHPVSPLSKDNGLFFLKCQENERGSVHHHGASYRNRNRKNSQVHGCSSATCFAPVGAVLLTGSSSATFPSLEPWAGRTELTGVVPCERSDAQPLSHGRRLLLGQGTALFSQLFVRCGEHQLSNEDSLQAAVIKALSCTRVF